ncbi:uncharacterized protein N0V89_002612 [Didymosphaeria variabile]|uniref:TauD/TfdA-like domain-containing protein n=1 Tax=Didymosphaeria variabile TaxID=1932322 RepID=A0A9W8XTU9_9PLEO|nr:uncharacterized protein N0V89_002612 [Didymosphaeria variabile]KAJ4358033.1 hypothetical protein N0V89_002612 [Didymosphaeria variabile]
MTTRIANTVTWVTPAAQSHPDQSDIDYAPNYEKWQARAARRLAAGGLETKLPQGFPEELEGKLVWDGKILAETYDWIYVLKDEQLAEIDEAVAYFQEENIMIYAGLSAHIAPQRGRQDQKYDGKSADVVLSHIKDLSRSDPDKIIGSPAYTTDKQVFHTDSGDLVSLFVLETALSGGASKLASTWKVYNEIARARPDLIHTLTTSWDYEMFVPS